MMKNESGRSMVEMLGVLAIIGVLSVGGIAGYTMAMNKYKANEILATATQMSIIAKTAAAGEGQAMTDLAAAGLTAPVSGVTMSADASGVVTVQGLTSAVAKALAGAAGGTCGDSSCVLTYTEAGKVTASKAAVKADDKDEKAGE